MAVSKLHIFFLVSFTLSQAGSALEEDEQVVFGPEAFRIELDKLNAKIHSLESVIDKMNNDLKSKDETIAHKEKSDGITSLRNEVKGSSDANGQVEKAHSQARAWIPPSLADFLSYAESHWGEHGKPAFQSLKQKTLEKKTQAEKWAEPHMQTIKTKWVLAAKERWESVITNVEPQLQSLTKKTKEVYIQTKNTLTPHIFKIKEVVDPHFQSVKKVCSPYIDQIATATKPHPDKAPICHCDKVILIKQRKQSLEMNSNA